MAAETQDLQIQKSEGQRRAYTQCVRGAEILQGGKSKGDG